MGLQIIGFRVLGFSASDSGFGMWVWGFWARAYGFRVTLSFESSGLRNFPGFSRFKLKFP